MNYKASILITGLFLLKLVNAQYITDVMINACGVEGLNEYIVLTTENDPLTVKTNKITINYGSALWGHESYLQSIKGNGKQIYVDGLNAHLTNCDFQFINAQVNTVIPPNTKFIVMNNDITSPYDFSSWCGNQLGSVYVIFTQDPSWKLLGNFRNWGGGPRYFYTKINGHEVNYNYNTLWIANQDGNYASWNRTGGAAVQYRNNSGCVVNVSTTPLPITLVSFNASSMKNNVTLDWTTAAEINNDFFTLERSTDATNWLTIGQVKGSGNSRSIKEYNYVDNNVPNGMYYYRLKQTDFNGVYSYSDIEFTTVESSQTTTFNCYPNPAQEIVNIQLSNKSQEIASTNIRIIDAIGRDYTNNVEITISEDLIRMNVSDLNAGSYFIQIASSTATLNSTFIKN